MTFFKIYKFTTREGSISEENKKSDTEEGESISPNAQGFYMEGWSRC